METRNLEWLQCLRGVAAILVVFTHARYFLLGTPSEGPAEAVFFPGAMGVDLFFLISGFIMAYTTRDADGTLKYTIKFLIKRGSRILPVYLVVAITGLLLVKNGEYLSAPIHLKEILLSFIFIPINSNNPPFFDMPWSVGWTLNFEMYFYLVFGLCLMAGKHRWTVAMLWLVASLIILPLITTGYVSTSAMNNYGFESRYLNLITNPMLWTFPAGVIAGVAFSTKLRLPRGHVDYSITLIAVAFAIWCAYSGLYKFHGMDQWGGPLALAFILLSISGSVDAIKAPPVLLWLGKISFSLYLCHPIAQQVLSKLITALGRPDLTHTWSHVFLTTSVALLLATISHHYLESRLSGHIRARLLYWADQHEYKIKDSKEELKNS
ncbi:acyltransferase family protein [Pseudomonas sp. LW8]|uniref:acyltransferase family protein n=1 Tax=Pseudomonas sp. LW8 TaxID=3242677 RepID=UPI0035C22D1F